MDDSPLKPLGGVPIASDNDHIWMSDFKSLGIYSKADESWTVAKLPWDEKQLDSLLLAVSEGSIRGFAAVCDGACGTSDSKLPEVRVSAFTTTGEGRETAVVEVGEQSMPIAGIRDNSVISLGESPALATFETLGKTLLISNDGKSSQVSSIDRNLKALCPTPAGFVGVELVNASEEGAVAWSPLPKGWEPDPRDAQRMVVGKDLNSLKPMTVTGEVREVLANWVGQATACIPQGLALIGTTSAWEYLDGTWQRRNSTMPSIVTNQDSIGLRPLPDGEMIGSIVSGQLVRSKTGDWSHLAADPVVLGLGDLRLTYKRDVPEATVIESGNED